MKPIRLQPIRTLLLCLLLHHLRPAIAFSSHRLLANYDLHSGRASACPQSLSYSAITSDGLLMPAASIKVGSQVCKGTGGKRIEEGSSLRSHGLILPSLVANPDVSFYAGVETDTRVCGSWAFNASTISWYIVNNHNEDIFDDQTKITLQPGYLYVTYAHFSDLCVYRTQIKRKKIETQPEASGSDIIAIATPEIEPTTAPEDESEPACFPGNALVHVEGRGPIRMEDLEVGDKVLSSQKGTKSAYSEVFAFSHRDANLYSSFIVILTSGGKSISLSPGHLLYLDEVPRIANEARVGHSVMTASGTNERIIGIEHRYEKGLFNPHTLSGTIIVNQVLATTWTSALSPVAATSLLSPLRWLYRTIPLRISTFTSSPLEIIIDCTRVCASSFRMHPRSIIKQCAGIRLR